jgi:LPS-assembly lipoprotein
MLCSSERRRLLLGVLALGFATTLAGCGFEPLYGNHGADANINAELAQVRVAPIANRTGQMLYNRLRDRLNPRGRPAEPRYVLEITILERGEELLLEPNETASRTSLELTALFQLREIESGATALKGQSRSTISYDIQNSQYATISSEQDVRDRATKQLSDDISTRLALYFSSGQAASTSVAPAPATAPAP